MEDNILFVISYLSDLRDFYCNGGEGDEIMRWRRENNFP